MGSEPDGPSIIGSKAENQYVGVQSGIMEPFARAGGAENAILVLDCRSLDWRTIPIPSNYAYIVADTMKSRRLSSGEYNKRRADCEEAVRLLSAHLPGLRSLRDVAPDTFNKLAGTCWCKSAPATSWKDCALWGDPLRKRDLPAGKLQSGAHQPEISMSFDPELISWFASRRISAVRRLARRLAAARSASSKSTPPTSFRSREVTTPPQASTRISTSATPPKAQVWIEWNGFRSIFFSTRSGYFSRSRLNHWAVWPNDSI